MKDQNLTEKESLELIHNMIQQSQKKLQRGSGNILLYYGYISVITSVLTYALCTLSQNPWWHFLWFALFGAMFFEKFCFKRPHPTVKTYMDKAIGNVWTVIQILITFTFLTLIVMHWFVIFIPYELMMPLCILYVAIGVSIMGSIMNEKVIMLSPTPSAFISIYMLSVLTIGQPSYGWNLLGGLAFLMMLVIPGHVLNHKINQSCSKN